MKKNKQDITLTILDRIYWTIIITSVLTLVALAYAIVAAKVGK